MREGCREEGKCAVSVHSHLSVHIELNTLSRPPRHPTLVLGAMEKRVHTQTLPTLTGPLFYIAIGRNTARVNPKRHVLGEASQPQRDVYGEGHSHDGEEGAEPIYRASGIPGPGWEGPNKNVTPCGGKGMLCAI